jgi:hypothetical protein
VFDAPARGRPATAQGYKPGTQPRPPKATAFSVSVPLAGAVSPFKLSHPTTIYKDKNIIKNSKNRYKLNQSFSKLFTHTYVYVEPFYVCYDLRAEPKHVTRRRERPLGSDAQEHAPPRIGDPPAAGAAAGSRTLSELRRHFVPGARRVS